MPNGPPTTLQKDAGYKPVRPTLTLDWERYLPHLKDYPLSLEEKQELFSILWNIAVCCAEQGIEFELPEIDGEPCVQNAGNSPELAADVLDYLHSNSEEDKMRRNKVEGRSE